MIIFLTIVKALKTKEKMHILMHRPTSKYTTNRSSVELKHFKSL